MNQVYYLINFEQALKRGIKYKLYLAKLEKFRKKFRKKAKEVISRKMMSVKQTKKQIANLIVDCSMKYVTVMKFFDLMKIQQNHYTDFTYAGNGAFAFVLKAFNKQIQKTVALKVAECDSNDLIGMESVLKEYELLENLASKYIVKVYNCFFLTVDDDSDEDSNGEEEEQIAERQIKEQKNQRKVYFVIEEEFCQSKFFQKYLHFC